MTLANADGRSTLRPNRPSARILNWLRFNLHQTTIAKIELGKRPLRVAEMFALSHVFRMPPGAVFFMVRANRDEVDGFDHLADLIGREEERLRDQREQWTKVLQNLVDVTVEHEWRRTHLISLMRSLAAGQEPDSRAIEWLADHDDRRRDSEQQHPASVTPDRALAHLGLEPASPDHAPQPLEVDHG